MLKTQVDIVSIMKTFSLQVADSFDSASIIAEFDTPNELIEYSEKNFDLTSKKFIEEFEKKFQETYVAEVIKQLKEQSVSFI